MPDGAIGICHPPTSRRGDRSVPSYRRVLATACAQRVIAPFQIDSAHVTRRSEHELADV